MANHTLEPHKAQIILWYVDLRFTEAMVIDGLAEQGLAVE